MPIFDILNDHEPCVSGEHCVCQYALNILNFRTELRKAEPDQKRFCDILLNKALNFNRDLMTKEHRVTKEGLCRVAFLEQAEVKAVSTSEGIRKGCPYVQPVQPTPDDLSRIIQMFDGPISKDELAFVRQNYVWNT